MPDFPTWRRTLAAALALPAALSAAAPPDPADPRAPVPPQPHRSAFENYRRGLDVPLGNWRGLNDDTARAGGWRAYAREAAERADAPASAASAAPAPAPAPHRHDHHGPRR